MAGDFDPYYIWLGIPPEEQPPHHYRLLGIRALEGSADVIQNAADRIMAQLRTYQAGHHSAESQKLLNEVAGARVCLLNPDKKAAYDAALRQRLTSQQATQSPPIQDRVDASMIGITEAWPPRNLSPGAHSGPRESIPIHKRPWFVPAACVAGLWCLVLAILPWALVERGRSRSGHVIDESRRQARSVGEEKPATRATRAIKDEEKVDQMQPPLATRSRPAQDGPVAPGTDGSSATVSPPPGTRFPPSDSAGFVGHIVPAGDIDFTPDGKRMMSAPMCFRLTRMVANQPREVQFDSIRIWEVETKRCLAEIPFQPEANPFVHTARLSADGRQLIWVQTSSIRIWDWEAKREVRVVPLVDATGAALTPDRRHMLVTHRQGDPLRLWDLATGQVVHRIQAVAQNGVHRLVLSNNGRFLMVFPGGSELHVIDRQTDAERLLRADHRGPIGAADFSPDGRWVISCARFVSAETPGEKEVRVWDLQTGQVVRHLKGHTHPVRYVHMSPRGTRAVSVSHRFDGILWNMEDGSELRRFSGVHDAIFNADGSRLILVAGTPPPTLRFWDLGDLAGPQGAPNVAAWSDDTIPSSSGVTASTGSTPATPSATLSSGGASQAPGIPLLSAAPGAKEIRQLDPGYNRTSTRRLALSADGKRLVTGPRSQSELAPRGGQPVWSTDPLYVWDVETGKRLATFEGHQADDLLGVYLLNEGRQVLSIGGRSARIWDAATGRPLRQLVGEKFTWWHALSSDGRRFYASDLSNIIAWDTLSGRQLGRMPLLQHLSGLALNGDGRFMLTAFQDGGARLWDLDRSMLIRSLQDTAEPFNRAVLSPDGSTFLAWSNIYRSGANAAELRLYSAKTGEMIRPLSGLRYPPATVWFLPNGVRAISVSSSIDGAVLWDVETGKPLRRLPRYGAFALSADGRHIAVGAGYGSGTSLVSVWDLGDDAGPPPKAIKPRSRKPGR